jgi:hypothetical protein
LALEWTKVGFKVYELEYSFIDLFPFSFAGSFKEEDLTSM